MNNPVSIDWIGDYSLLRYDSPENHGNKVSFSGLMFERLMLQLSIRIFAHGFAWVSKPRCVLLALVEIW